MSTSAFISYSREDSEFALRLATDLKAAGAQVWLDQLDIKPGRPWDNAIEDALTDAPQMLVILSPASSKSQNVRDEIDFALRGGKIVVPILYIDCVIPLRLGRSQRIDFRADYAGGLTHLLDHLRVTDPDPAVLQQAAEGDAQRQAAWQAREAEAQRLREITHRQQREATKSSPSSRYPIVFYPRRGKYSALFLILAVLAVYCALLALVSPTGEPLRWAFFAFAGLFGGVSLIFLTFLFPRVTFLRLDEVGFTYAAFFRKRSRQWEEIASFVPLSLASVGWILKPEYRSSGKRRTDRSPDGMLPCLYRGTSPEELAELMNDCRVDAL